MSGKMGEDRKEWKGKGRKMTLNLSHENKVKRHKNGTSARSGLTLG